MAANTKSVFGGIIESGGDYVQQESHAQSEGAAAKLHPIVATWERGLVLPNCLIFFQEKPEI